MVVVVVVFAVLAVVAVGFGVEGGGESAEAVFVELVVAEVAVVVGVGGGGRSGSFSFISARIRCLCPMKPTSCFHTVWSCASRLMSW